MRQHVAEALGFFRCFELYSTVVLSFAEIVEFQKIVGSLIELVDQLAKAAESEKMKVRCS